MIGVGDALDLVLRDVPALGAEQVALPVARGRVVAETIVSARDVPPFRNSAMDGYAVRADDLRGAAPSSPVSLEVCETLGAGSVASVAVESGQAVRIMTGAPVPPGADTVVRIEDTEARGASVAILREIRCDANVRHPGEDVRSGSVVLEAGHWLRPADIGLLASVGVATVRVARRPRVAIIATGDELVDLGQIPGPGQIVNSNAYTLAAAVEEFGGQPMVLGIVPDWPELLSAAFAEALRADVVLSTGGVSVGSFDYVRDTLGALGYGELFWKVAQKPGKPLSFGQCSGTPVFGLPGNPVSSLVCFYLYTVPLLRAMMGLQDVHLPREPAVMAETLRVAESMTELVRCALRRSAGGELRAYPTGSQSSGVLRSLSLGDALVIAPAGCAELREGESVQALLLRAEPRSAEPPF